MLEIDGRVYRKFFVIILSEHDDDQIEFLICNLAVFYKGSVSINELEEMPLPKVFKLKKHADKIISDIKKEHDKMTRK